MKRRGFFKQSGLLALGAYSFSHLDALASPIKGKTINNLGVQLFSVRDILPANPQEVMTKLAQMGYKQFESFSGPKGFLWGYQPKEMKSFLDSIGVNMLSTHFNYLDVVNKPDELKRNIDLAAETGLKYLICPWIGGQKTWDDWKRIADQLNKTGEQVSQSGLKFGYHNHDYSFKPLEGKLPQDYLLDNTSAKNVMFELDLCWIDVAGINTAEHLKKYGKRYELCHIKDYTKIEGKPVQKDLGHGSVNIKKTLEECKKSGISHFIVEQEQYPVSSLDSLKANAEFMAKLKV